MGKGRATIRLLLSTALAFASLSFLGPSAARAATYPPKFFLLNLHLGYESINPSEMNARLSGLANLNGLIGSRIRGERGLIYPDWSHWVEVGFFINDAGTRDLIGTVDSDLKQSIWFLSVIPLGGTFWFFKTAYVDFGASFGLGAALAMNYASSITTVSTGAVTQSGSFTNPFAPIVDAKLQLRLWFAKFWALDGAAGVRFLSTRLTDTTGAAFNADLLSFSVVFGATYAFGGYKGVGRTYAEVLKGGQTQQPTVPTTPTVPAAPVKPASPAAPKSRVAPGVVR